MLLISKSTLKIFFLSYHLLLIGSYAQSIQRTPQGISDPCGYPDTSLAEFKTAAALNWGYGFADLEKDVARWRLNPLVSVSIIGKSVQSRDLYLLTITSPNTSFVKKRVWIHARTHPNEVEGTYVTNEIILALLSDTPMARMLLDHFIFTIVPMINPDGVELKKPRENANNIDIESNWNTQPHQPEVQAMKTQLAQLMQSPAPIALALNMHSAYNCKRYFVYHDVGGTSLSYTVSEKKFISHAQYHFPNGFENYNYFVSWVNGTALQYPESWFWVNHREAVLALTYEDMNCDQHGQYDRTAYALLAAIGSYFGVISSIGSTSVTDNPSEITLPSNHPNPFSTSTTIRFRLTAEASEIPSPTSLTVYDALGREINMHMSAFRRGDLHEIFLTPAGSESGLFFYRLQVGNKVKTGIMHRFADR